MKVQKKSLLQHQVGWNRLRYSYYCVLSPHSFFLTAFMKGGGKLGRVNEVVREVKRDGELQHDLSP